MQPSAMREDCGAGGPELGLVGSSWPSTVGLVHRINPVNRMYATHAQHLWTRPRPQPAARLRRGRRDAAASPRPRARLYLTQPAVSAALRRLTTAVGAPLFVRSGRGLALTSRGERLRAALRPAPRSALVEAALAPAHVRSGDQRAHAPPRPLRLGRAVAAAAAAARARARGAAACGSSPSRCSSAPSAPRSPPGSTRRSPSPTSCPRRSAASALFCGRLRLPLRSAPRAPVERADRGASTSRATTSSSRTTATCAASSRTCSAEPRNVRCSVSSFANIGAIVEDSRLLATVPDIVAAQIRASGRTCAPNRCRSARRRVDRAAVARGHRRRRGLQVRARRIVEVARAASEGDGAAGRARGRAGRARAR